MEQHRLRHPEVNGVAAGSPDDPAKMAYRDLLKQLTSYQHAILIDLGKGRSEKPTALVTTVGCGGSVRAVYTVATGEKYSDWARPVVSYIHQ